MDKYIYSTYLITGGVLEHCNAIENDTSYERYHFQVYDNKNFETIIYKYDVQAETVNEIGRVAGYFHNCKINSKKRCILKAGWNKTFSSYSSYSSG